MPYNFQNTINEFIAREEYQNAYYLTKQEIINNEKNILDTEKEMSNINFSDLKENYIKILDLYEAMLYRKKLTLIRVLYYLLKVNSNSYLKELKSFCDEVNYFEDLNLDNGWLHKNLPIPISQAANSIISSKTESVERLNRLFQLIQAFPSIKRSIHFPSMCSGFECGLNHNKEILSEFVIWKQS